MERPCVVCVPPLVSCGRSAFVSARERIRFDSPPSFPPPSALHCVTPSLEAFFVRAKKILLAVNFGSLPLTMLLQG